MPTMEVPKVKFSAISYRTLGLLNGHAAPSFMRTVLFSRISRNYIPAPKANFTWLVIR